MDFKISQNSIEMWSTTLSKCPIRMDMERAFLGQCHAVLWAAKFSRAARHTVPSTWSSLSPVEPVGASASKNDGVPRCVSTESVCFCINSKKSKSNHIAKLQLQPKSSKIRDVKSPKKDTTKKSFKMCLGDLRLAVTGGCSNTFTTSKKVKP